MTDLHSYPNSLVDLKTILNSQPFFRNELLQTPLYPHPTNDAVDRIPCFF